MKAKLKSIIAAYHMAVGHRVAAAMVCALCVVGLAAVQVSYAGTEALNLLRPAFGPDASGQFFRYEIVSSETNLVFSVTNTVEKIYYAVDYNKSASEDQWIEGTPVVGSNNITSVSAPAAPAGTNWLYRVRVADDPICSDLIFEAQDDGSFIVKGLGDGFTGKKLLIPAIHNGAAVTAINQSAFKDEDQIEEVELPVTIGAISESAFENCTGLKFIVIPESVNSIGEKAFDGSMLEAVYFDGNAPTLESGAFPANAVLHVKSGATGFGTVPGTYMGYTTVLWPDTLPVGYALPGAIRADGNSYIRTGYLHKKDTRVECRVSVADSEAGEANATIFGGGAGTGEPMMAFRAKYNSKAVAAYLEGNTNIVYGETENILSHEPFPYAAAADLIRTVDLECSKEAARWSGNGVLGLMDTSKISLGEATGEQDIIVFAQNAGDGTPQSGTMSKCTLGWFKIYEEGDTPVHDFRPCKILKTGELGLFDVADNGVADSERFKSAQGSGHITEVRDAMQEPEPEMGDEYTDSYTRMDEVRVNGTQWLDLGYTQPEGATVRLAGGIKDYTPWNLALYGQGQGSKEGPYAIKDLFIYENGRLVRHYIPTERTAGYVKGLYETFTSNFVENVGESGSYIIPRLPVAYQEVEYIENSLGQYIDTKYVPNDNSAFTIDFNYKGKIDGSCVIFGSGSGFGATGSSSILALGEASSKICGLIGTLTFCPNEDTYEYELNNRYKISLSRNGMTVNNEGFKIESGSSDNPGFTGTSNLYIFGANNGSGLANASKIKLMSFSISENGVLQRDFVPCYRKDNPSKPLLLDLVHLGQEGCEYDDGAGGQFSAGPEVKNR